MISHNIKTFSGSVESRKKVPQVPPLAMPGGANDQFDFIPSQKAPIAKNSSSFSSTTTIYGTKKCKTKTTKSSMKFSAAAYFRDRLKDKDRSFYQSNLDIEDDSSISSAGNSAIAVEENVGPKPVKSAFKRRRSASGINSERKTPSIRKQPLNTRHKSVTFKTENLNSSTAFMQAGSTNKRPRIDQKRPVYIGGVFDDPDLLLSQSSAEIVGKDLSDKLPTRSAGSDSCVMQSVSGSVRFIAPSSDNLVHNEVSCSPCDNHTDKSVLKNTGNLAVQGGRTGAKKAVRKNRKKSKTSLESNSDNERTAENTKEVHVGNLFELCTESQVVACDRAREAILEAESFDLIFSQQQAVPDQEASNSSADKSRCEGNKSGLPTNHLTVAERAPTRNDQLETHSIQYDPVCAADVKLFKNQIENDNPEPDLDVTVSSVAAFEGFETEDIGIEPTSSGRMADSSFGFSFAAGGSQKSQKTDAEVGVGRNGDADGEKENDGTDNGDKSLGKTFKCREFNEKEECVIDAARSQQLSSDSDQADSLRSMTLETNKLVEIVDKSSRDVAIVEQTRPAKKFSFGPSLADFTPKGTSVIHFDNVKSSVAKNRQRQCENGEEVIVVKCDENYLMKQMENFQSKFADTPEIVESSKKSAKRRSNVKSKVGSESKSIQDCNKSSTPFIVVEKTARRRNSTMINNLSIGPVEPGVSPVVAEPVDASGSLTRGPCISSKLDQILELGSKSVPSLQISGMKLATDTRIPTPCSKEVHEIEMSPELFCHSEGNRSGNSDLRRTTTPGRSYSELNEDDSKAFGDAKICNRKYSKNISRIRQLFEAGEMSDLIGDLSDSVICGDLTKYGAPDDKDTFRSLSAPEFGHHSPFHHIQLDHGRKRPRSAPSAMLGLSPASSIAECTIPDSSTIAREADQSLVTILARLTTASNSLSSYLDNMASIELESEQKALLTYRKKLENILQQLNLRFPNDNCSIDYADSNIQCNLDTSLVSCSDSAAAGNMSSIPFADVPRSDTCGDADLSKRGPGDTNLVIDTAGVVTEIPKVIITSKEGALSNSAKPAIVTCQTPVGFINDVSTWKFDSVMDADFLAANNDSFSDISRIGAFSCGEHLSVQKNASKNSVMESKLSVVELNTDCTDLDPDPTDSEVNEDRITSPKTGDRIFNEPSDVINFDNLDSQEIDDLLSTHPGINADPEDKCLNRMPPKDSLKCAVEFSDRNLFVGESCEDSGKKKLSEQGLLEKKDGSVRNVIKERNSNNVFEKTSSADAESVALATVIDDAAKDEQVLGLKKLSINVSRMDTGLDSGNEFISPANASSKALTALAAASSDSARCSRRRSRTKTPSKPLISDPTVSEIIDSPQKLRITRSRSKTPAKHASKSETTKITSASGKSDATSNSKLNQVTRSESKTPRNVSEPKLSSRGNISSNSILDKNLTSNASKDDAVSLRDKVLTPKKGSNRGITPRRVLQEVDSGRKSTQSVDPFDSTTPNSEVSQTPRKAVESSGKNSESDGRKSTTKSKLYVLPSGDNVVKRGRTPKKVLPLSPRKKDVKNKFDGDCDRKKSAGTTILRSEKLNNGDSRKSIKDKAYGDAVNILDDGENVESFDGSVSKLDPLLKKNNNIPVSSSEASKRSKRKERVEVRGRNDLNMKSSSANEDEDILNALVDDQTQIKLKSDRKLKTSKPDSVEIQASAENCPPMDRTDSDLLKMMVSEDLEVGTNDKISLTAKSRANRNGEKMDKIIPELKSCLPEGNAKIIRHPVGERENMEGGVDDDDLIGLLSNDELKRRESFDLSCKTKSIVNLNLLRDTNSNFTNQDDLDCIENMMEMDKTGGKFISTPRSSTPKKRSAILDGQRAIGTLEKHKDSVSKKRQKIELDSTLVDCLNDDSFNEEILQLADNRAALRSRDDMGTTAPAVEKSKATGRHRSNPNNSGLAGEDAKKQSPQSSKASVLKRPNSAKFISAPAKDYPIKFDPNKPTTSGFTATTRPFVSPRRVQIGKPVGTDEIPGGISHATAANSGRQTAFGNLGGKHDDSRQHMSRNCRPSTSSGNRGGGVVTAGSGRPGMTGSKTSVVSSFVFCWSGLNASQVKNVEKLVMAMRAGKSRIFSPEVTHLIVNAESDKRCDRTLKYIQALASGRPVVSYSWVEACIQKQSVQPWPDYEVVGDRVNLDMEGGSRRSRMDPNRLLGGYCFAFWGSDPALNGENLRELGTMSGAKVVEIDKLRAVSLKTMTTPCLIVTLESSTEEPLFFDNLNKRTGAIPLNREWFLDCITQHKILPVKDYVLGTGDLYQQLVAAER